MHRLDLPEWADRFVLSRDLQHPDRAAEFRRARRAGELERVAPGAYLPSELLLRLTPAQRHLATMRAAAITARRPLLFSGPSAAVGWQLPMLGAPPDRAHVVASGGVRQRSTVALVRQTSSRQTTPVEIDGLLVTPLARTVIDLAARLPFDAAVVAADAALRRTDFPLNGLPRTRLTSAALRSELQLLPHRHGAVRAALVVNFADAGAQLPGESLSRVSLMRAGIPAPVLQQSLRGASGKEYFGDFWWPGPRLIGEFDGAVKYSDPAYLAGRTPQQALIEEKEREDDLRLAGYRMCRWGWAVARDPRALRARLLRAGLEL